MRFRARAVCASQGEKMAAALAKNAVTMCASMSAGDAISQQIQAHYEQQDKLSEDSSWDRHRTVKMGTVGLCVQGPLFHGMYLAADRVCGRSAVMPTVLRKVAFTTACAPLHLSCLFASVALVDTRGDVGAAASKVVETVPGVFAAGAAFWPAVNVGLFKFVATPATRVKAAAFASMIWNIFLAYKANNDK